MFLSKEALESHRFTPKKIDGKTYGRYGLQGIRVLPDGSTVATDGNKLIHFIPASMPDASDFPSVDGFESSDDPLEPFILPKDAAIAVKKALPRRANMPILQLAAIDTKATNANGHATIAVTDLENPQVFRPMKLEGTFPAWENVVPKDGDQQDGVGMSVEHLLSIAQTLKAQGFKGVKVSFGKEKHLDTGSTVQPDSLPITFDAEGDAGTVKIVLMPYNLD